MGFWDWFLGRQSGGDGSSPAQAVVVNSVREEYAWIQSNCHGFQFEQQSLQHIDGKPYDVMRLRNARGETRTVYFDISSFFGKF